MKNVRLIYKKYGSLKFVSHLDMNRFMTRILRKSKIPVWYTEGFHKHTYITFALPLSLGFCSEWEVMDFKISDDDFEIKKAEELIKSVCPDGIEVIELCEPEYKSGKITAAEFKIDFAADSGVTVDNLNDFLSQESIVVYKKSKKGTVSEIDIAPKILKYNISRKTADENGEKIGENGENGENTVSLTVKLPAGAQDNLNPKMLTAALFEKISSKHPFCTYNRTMLYVADGVIFK